METITREQIGKAIRDVGLESGDIVYVQCRLSSPGRVAGVRSREAFCDVYLEELQRAISPAGTVVVPTYTTQVARFDVEFVWEETPSLMGVFSEHVRMHPDSLRSMHPLSSLCALGPGREEICGNNSTTNFGWGSPFHRLYIAGAKILTIGLESGYVVGIAHPLEAVCGLPYVYNKLLKWSPVVSGVRDPRPYFATVRHLHLSVEYDLSRWVQHIRRLGGVRSSRLGSSRIHCSNYRTVFDEGAGMLRDDPYWFLREPPSFEYGVVPFDGPTHERDRIAAADDHDKVAAMNWTGYYLMHRRYAGGDEDEI